MESISIDVYIVEVSNVELSSLIFEEPSLKSYRYFIDVKIVSGDREKCTRGVNQEYLRMKQSFSAKNYKRLNYRSLFSYMPLFRGVP